MLRTDFVSLALRPFIDLTADPDVAPSLMAAAALHWANELDATAWSAAAIPPQRFRRLLARAGIPGNPDDVYAMELPDDIRRRLLATCDRKTGDASKSLWAARLLLQLGFRARGAALLRSMDGVMPQPVWDWRDVLLAQCDGAPLSSIATAKTSLASRLAGVTFALQHAMDNRHAIAPLLAAAFAVVDEIEAQDATFGAIAATRIARFQVPLWFQSEDPESSAQHVERQRERLATRRAATTEQLRFLMDDAERLLLEAAVTEACRVGNFPTADRLSEMLLKLDPTGAQAHFLAGEIARAHGQPAAREHYRTAMRCGVLEREAALARLLDIGIASNGNPDRPDALPGVIADVLHLHPGGQIERATLLEKHRAKLEPTVAADVMRWVDRIVAPADATQRSGTVAPPLPLPLERLRPYLDLTQPRGLGNADTPPVVIQTPLMAWDSVKQRRMPWYEATHPQRIPPAPFRRELAGAADFLGSSSGATSASLDVWLTAPDGCPTELRERLAGAADAPLLDRTLLARLLIALGFQREGQSLMPGPDQPVRTPEEAFALSTWIYAELILSSADKDALLDPYYRRLHEQLGSDGIYGRLRLINCFNAAVSAFRRRDIATLAYWRAEGERALAFYATVAETDDFSVAMLTSRFHRAMSFLPYLTGDHDLLRTDMDRWLGIARELSGHDERTRVLTADNLFPAVETAFRTEAYLGNQAAAAALVEELAYKIDPLEAKTWIQLAEFRMRGNDVAGALKAYLHAAHLTVPYARLAWFNAGQCYEKLRQPDDAVECYLKSLAHWPTGISPLRRIRQLAMNSTIVADKELLLAWTARQPAWSAIKNAA
jgi:hypothetical protein